MNRVSLRCIALAAAACLLTFPAAAHPGHGLSEHGPLHLATSPFHIATLLSVGAALWLVSRLATQPFVRRCLGAMGTVAIAVAGVFWGLGV